LGFLTHHLKVENGEDITDLFSDIKTSWLLLKKALPLPAF
jgi:hypothetical protein